MPQIPNIQEIDTILFNELMNMLNGDLAMSRYISQNVKRSGLEIWRKLNKNNDPSTYGSKEMLKRQIEQLAAIRSKDIRDFTGFATGKRALLQYYTRALYARRKYIKFKKALLY